MTPLLEWPKPKYCFVFLLTCQANIVISCFIVNIIIVNIVSWLGYGAFFTRCVLFSKFKVVCEIWFFFFSLSSFWQERGVWRSKNVEGFDLCWITSCSIWWLSVTAGRLQYGTPRVGSCGIQVMSEAGYIHMNANLNRNPLSPQLFYFFTKLRIFWSHVICDRLWQLLLSIGQWHRLV